MAKILKIHIEGFGSVIAKIKYKFDRPGLNLISGKNGAGKTTIFNALAVCLYGQTLKPKSSILPWPGICDSNYIGCKIRVDLDNNIQIIRCFEYKGKVYGRKGGNRLLIIKDGIPMDQYRDKASTQIAINELIGYSFQLFKTSVLFAQELNSLLEEDGPTKKKTFDEAFASAFINRAKENAETKLITLTKEYEKFETTIKSKGEMLEKCTSLLRQMVEANKSFAHEKARIISNLRKKVRILKDEVKALRKKYQINTKRPEIKQAIEVFNNKRDVLANTIDSSLGNQEFQLMLDITRYSEEVDKIQAEKEAIKAENNKTCSYCGAKLKGDAIKQYRQEKKRKYTELKNKEREVKRSLIHTTNRRNLCLKQMEDQKEVVSEFNECSKKIKQLQAELDGLNIIHQNIKLKLSIGSRNKKTD